MQQWKNKSPRGEDDGDQPTDVSEVFFELANAPWVKYRRERDGGEINVAIRQDVQGAAQQHTGGIVWETAYLLLEYLLSSVQEPNSDADQVSNGDDDQHSLSGVGNKFVCRVLDSILDRCSSKPTTRKDSKNRKIVELGAGCGMLGIVLASVLEQQSNETDNASPTCSVIVTETGEVMRNLESNCRNNRIGKCLENLHEKELDWTTYKEDCARGDPSVDPGSIDLIVGTDVVFSTRFVEPMLQTMEYVSHDDTCAILCLQERCADAHALLLVKAGEYGFTIKDSSEMIFDAYPACAWGRDLDCKLLVFTRTKPNKKEKKKKRKGARRRNNRKTRRKSDLQTKRATYD